MKDYIVSRYGVSDYLVLKSTDGIFITIATCPIRDYAEQIVDALNQEIQSSNRVTWDDLEAAANQRGR